MEILFCRKCNKEIVFNEHFYRVYINKTIASGNYCVKCYEEITRNVSENNEN